MDCAEGKSNGGESYVITVYFNPWNVAVLSSKGGEKEEGSVVENNFKMGQEAWTRGNEREHRNRGGGIDNLGVVNVG